MILGQHGPNAVRLQMRSFPAHVASSVVCALGARASCAKRLSRSRCCCAADCCGSGPKNRVLDGGPHTIAGEGGLLLREDMCQPILTWAYLRVVRLQGMRAHCAFVAERLHHPGDATFCQITLDTCSVCACRLLSKGKRSIAVSN